MIELEEADHLVGGLRQSGIGAADQARGHVAPMLLACEDQVLAHREFWKHLQQLEGSADSELVELGGAQAGHDLAVELDLAAGRRELAEDAVEQRRLAATVRPDQAEDLALADVEADAVDRGDAAKALLDVGDFEDCAHCTVSSRDFATARNADAALVRRSAR